MNLASSTGNNVLAAILLFALNFLAFASMFTDKVDALFVE